MKQCWVGALVNAFFFFFHISVKILHKNDFFFGTWIFCDNSLDHGSPKSQSDQNKSAKIPVEHCKNVKPILPVENRGLFPDLKFFRRFFYKRDLGNTWRQVNI